jgi:hypothetical protein
VEAKQIAQQDAERAKFIVEKVSGPGARRTETDNSTGGARTASGGDSGGGRGGGGVDDFTVAGEGGRGVHSAAEDRGEQGDCAVAGAERQCHVGAGVRNWRPA